jgi:hypothetical protein
MRQRGVQKQPLKIEKSRGAKMRLCPNFLIIIGILPVNIGLIRLEKHVKPSLSLCLYFRQGMC